VGRPKPAEYKKVPHRNTSLKLFINQELNYTQIRGTIS
jgi:hypothetical protein